MKNDQEQPKMQNIAYVETKNTNKQTMTDSTQDKD